VRLRSPFVPALVTGRLRGPGARPGLPIAVAVNGVVAATCRSSRLAGDRHVYLSSVLPPGALRDGRNRVEAFLIVGRGRLQRL
jgi:hypothetical protein